MANFCLSTGIQPSEYLAMTEIQRRAFIQETHRMSERRR